MEILVILIVSITLAEMMFAMGLRLSFTKLTGSLGNNRGLVTRAVIANYLIIPGITVIFIRIFDLSPMVGAALLILGVSPGAPYGPPFTAIARGNLAISTGLMVILAGTSAFMVPLLLHLFLPVISSGELALKIDIVKLISILFVIQLLPLCIGLAFGEWQPRTASLLLNPASHASKALNILMIGTIAALQFKVLSGVGMIELFIMVSLVAVALLAGWLLGWKGRENRASVSIITAMRNMSLSMGIAATSFPASAVVTTVLAYSFIAGFGVLVFAFALRSW